MSKQTEQFAVDINALKETYAGLNGNDIDACVMHFDADIAWIAAPEYGGTYHGLAAVKAHLAEGRSHWAEGSCAPEQFVVAGGKIVVFLNVHVRLKDETTWRDGRHAAAYTFANGKATEMRIFDDAQQAIAWAEGRT